MELRANGLHVHVRSVISGITPFVDLFVNLESLRAIPLLHTEEKKKESAFLSWGNHSSSEHVLPGQNLGLFGDPEKKKKRVVTFADEKRDADTRDSRNHALCGRVLIPLPLSDIAKDAHARSGSSVSVSMLVDVAIGPLSMWWDTEMAAVVLEVLTVENSNIAEATMSSSPSSYKAERRSRRGTAVMMKLVEEWSLPNWKYVVTLSSIMVRGARQSSSSSDDGVGVRGVRAITHGSECENFLPHHSVMFSYHEYCSLISLAFDPAHSNSNQHSNNTNALEHRYSTYAVLRQRWVAVNTR